MKLDSTLYEIFRKFFTEELFAQGFPARVTCTHRGTFPLLMGYIGECKYNHSSYYTTVYSVWNVFNKRLRTPSRYP